MSQRDGGAGEAARREARLAEALRANLRRRKEQARARGSEDTSTQEAAKPRDDAGKKL